MEQFSLAMWLVERKLKGIDPPNTLSPEMVPPGNRTVTPSNAVQVRILILGICCFSINKHFKSNP